MKSKNTRSSGKTLGVAPLERTIFFHELYCHMGYVSHFCKDHPTVAVDCIALNYLGKHKQEMAIRGIN